MKKFLMVAITLIASVSVFGQEYGSSAEWGYKAPKREEPTQKKSLINQPQKKSVGSQVMNFAGYYGTDKVIGFDFTGGKNIMYGIGFSTYVGHGGVGRDYSNTMGPKAFSSEIYEKITAKNVSFYGIVGYKVTKELIVQGKLGYGGSTTYFNAYDKRQILSTNGYYFTSQDGGGNVLLGGSVQYVIDNISPYVGYDNFNGLKIGLGYNF